MRSRLLALPLACAALAACNPSPPEPVHAGDAGYVYERVDAAPAPRAEREAGAPGTPAVAIVAGVPGGRGDVDGTGAEARIGLVGGMVRVGDAIVFADEGNGSVRRFVPATGAVETLARLPAVENGRPSLPAYVAWDGKKRVFVTDRSRHVIYALDLDTRALSLYAGKPSVRGEADGDLAQALFDTPTGLAFDGDHTLFVGDVGNRHIRRIDLSNGKVSTWDTVFPQVWGLCVAPDGLYAADNLNEAIYRVDTKTGASTVLAGSDRFGYGGPTDGPARTARFREPRGLACGKDALYVADRGNEALRKIDWKTGAVKTIAGHNDKVGIRDGYAEGAMFSDVQSVLEWGDTLYVGDDGTLRALTRSDMVVRTVAGAPDQTEVALPDRTLVARPEGVAFVASENTAYVASCASYTVQRIDLATREATTLAGMPFLPGFADGVAGDARFHCVAAIAYDGAGNLFVADRGDHAVRGIRTDTRRVVTIAGSPSRCGNDDGPLETATFCDPSGLVFAQGALYVADSATATVRKIDLAARTVSTVAGAPFALGYADGKGKDARFDAPTGIAYQAGALFVADRENDVVRRIDLGSGDVTTIAGVAGQPGDASGPRDAVRFSRPRGLSSSGDGALLVTDRVSVRRLSLADGRVTSILPAGVAFRASPPSLSVPGQAVEVAPGDALVLDRQENLVLRLTY